MGSGRFTIQARALLSAILAISACSAFSVIRKNGASSRSLVTRSYGERGSINAVLSAVILESSASLSRSTVSSPQVLEFVEPTTGVRVVLIGSMHYNPASIRLASDTIESLAVNNQLGSVIIESCDLRWNTTQKSSPIVQKLLQSEMKAAHDMAMYYGRPVVLGDQLINITVSELGRGAKETLLDLLAPASGGWQRLAANISAARQEAFPAGPEYLGLGSFFEPRLLLAAPISFLKYPASYFVKSPLAVLAVLSLLSLADSATAAVTGGATATDSLQELTLADWLESGIGAVLEIVVFARVFLKELLADRNEILAQNILRQCRLYQGQTATQQEGNWFSLQSLSWLSNLGASPFSNPAGASSTTDVPYAPGSVIPKSGSAAGDNNGEKVVVAVLGLAHCNGIAKLLKEQQVA